MIIRRYISRQLLQTTLIVCALLVFILMGGRFIKYMSEAAEGRILGQVVFTVILFRLPDFLQMILPLGLLLGILLVFGRMHLDSEMVVWNNCGLDGWRLLQILLLPVLCMMGTVACFSLFLGPWGAREAETIIYKQKNQSAFVVLTPGRFHFSKPVGRTVYAKDLTKDRKAMQNVFIAEQNVDLMVVVAAKRGQRYWDEASGVQYLVLHDGYRYEGKPGQADFRVIAFSRYQVRLAEPEMAKEVPKIKAMTTYELILNESPWAQAELQWRISLPLMVPIIVLIAVPLSRVSPRQGRFLKMLPAILLYLSYLALLSGGKVLIERQSIPTWLGIWWVHGIFFLVALGINGFSALRWYLIRLQSYIRRPIEE